MRFPFPLLPQRTNKTTRAEPPPPFSIQLQKRKGDCRVFRTRNAKIATNGVARPMEQEIELYFVIVGILFLVLDLQEGTCNPSRRGKPWC
jgi:hypothetical protein